MNRMERRFLPRLKSCMRMLYMPICMDDDLPRENVVRII